MTFRTNVRAASRKWSGILRPGASKRIQNPDSSPRHSTPGASFQELLLLIPLTDRRLMDRLGGGSVRPFSTGSPRQPCVFEAALI